MTLPVSRTEEEMVERWELGLFAKTRMYIILRDGTPDHSRFFETRAEAEKQVRQEIWDAALAKGRELEREAIADDIEAEFNLPNALGHFAMRIAAAIRQGTKEER